MMGEIKRLTIPISFLIILPIAMTLILGLEFRDQVITGVPFGIVDLDNSSLSRTLIENIKTNDTFNVIYEGNSKDDILNEIQKNKIVSGIIIPENFSKDVVNRNSPNLLVIYDGCQMSMAGAAKAKISEVLATIRIGASLQVMQARLNISQDEAMMYVQPIGSEVRFLGNPWKSSGYFFITGIIANMIQLAVYFLAVEAVEKENSKIPCPLNYSILSGMLAALVTVAAVFILDKMFGFPMEGSYGTIAILSLLNMIGVANLGGIFRFLFPEKGATIEVSMLIMATLLLSGYTYPVLAMPKLYQVISKYVPFTHAVVPIRDVILLGRSFSSVIPNILFLLMFVILGSLLLLLLWHKHEEQNRTSSQDLLQRG
ncbi:MAG: ABC transporter permease [Anaerovorax sp.]|nr:ABC transporter permease [Anaerovorax sp.]